MRQSAKVSVILPTYNRAAVVAKAIDSVLKQTYQAFEIIIVDDGSIDKTEDIVNSYKDERIIYIKHKRNKGAGAARNTGITNARGDYIAFQDSDAEWLPEKLEKQVRVFSECSPEVGVVFSGFWKVWLDKRIYIPSTDKFLVGSNSHVQMLYNNVVDTPAALVRRACFEKSGYFDDYLRTWEDWELWIRISTYYQFKFIDEALYYSYYTKGGVNESGSLTELKTYIYITEKHLSEFKLHRSILACHYKEIARSFCNLQDYKRGFVYYVKAFKVYPLNIKYLGAVILLSTGLRSIYNKLDRFYLDKESTRAQNNQQAHSIN